MDITSLPKTITKNGILYGLRVIYDTPGWIVTYMNNEKDFLDIDFSPTLQDAIDEVCRKLDIKPELITKTWLELHGYQHKNDYGIDTWTSEDGRVIITNLSNSIGRDWNVHIDNEDFQTIGGLDIQETWQLETILRLSEIKRES